MDTLRRATNLNRNTLLPQGKKTIGFGPTISAVRQEMSRSHQFHPTTPNTPSRTDTLLIHEPTNKIHTEPLPAHIGMIGVTNRIIPEAGHNNIWLSVSLPRDKGLPLHADIAEGARFDAPDLTRIQKGAAPTASDSNRSVYSLPSRPKPRLSSLHMLSTLACAIWE